MNHWLQLEATPSLLIKGRELGIQEHVSKNNLL